MSISVLHLFKLNIKKCNLVRFVSLVEFSMINLDVNFVNVKFSSIATLLMLSFSVHLSIEYIQN